MKCTRKMLISWCLVLAFLMTTVASVVPGGLGWSAEGVYAAEDGTDEDAQGGASAVSDDGTESSSESTEAENIKIGEFGTSVGDVTIEGDFILTYTFYSKSYGTDAWDNFVVEIRDENYNWFDVRADNYGWLYYVSSGYMIGSEGIEFGNGASDWDVWTSLMQQGQECVVHVIRQGTTITVITKSAGDTFYAVATVDTYTNNCPLYIHLTGESCDLSNVSYSFQTKSSWSESDQEYIDNLKAQAADNNEGGEAYSGGVSLDGTTLMSTEWWSGVTGVELSSSSNNATWNYTILTESSVSDFGIEVYNSDGSKYITTLTNGDGWYYGDIVANDLVISGDSISDSLERGKLYYVTVERQEDDFTIYYFDSSGEMLLAFFATDTNMDETAYVHFYAEYGTFVVAATLDEGTSIEQGDTETGDNTGTGTDDTEDTEESEDTEYEDTEDVEEAPDDDDEDDEDYDIEDLDTDDEDDSDSSDEDDDSIEVILETATYRAQTWWSGSYGSASAWIGDAVWVYSVKVDEIYGQDAFSVEIYDGEGNYITLCSDGTAWYYGVTGEEIVVSGDPIVLQAGAQYVVVVNREGADFLITFYKEDGTELLSYYAADTDMSDTVASHFYGQIGAYTVDVESAGTEEADIDDMGVTDGSLDRSNGSKTANSSVRTGDVSFWGWLLMAVAGMELILCACYRKRRPTGE